MKKHINKITKVWMSDGYGSIYLYVNGKEFQARIYVNIFVNKENFEPVYEVRHVDNNIVMFSFPTEREAKNCILRIYEYDKKYQFAK